jgi:hypothetical protein
MGTKDYQLIFHTMKRTDTNRFEKVEYGVEFNVLENVDQIFGRIARKLNRPINPDDFIVIRHNSIELNEPDTK